MIHSGKPILIFLVILMLIASQVFAVDTTIDFSQLQKITESFSEEMLHVLPFSSTIGLNWSDAYIGSFPHFGIGISAGAVMMDYEKIKNMLEYLKVLKVDYTTFALDMFLLPAYSFDARIGLPVIPVDFGVKFGYLPPKLLSSYLRAEIKNTLIGADVRYVIVNSKVLPMRLSVGLGFNYLNGEVSKEFTDNINFTGGGINFKADKPTVGVIWKTTNIELKMQASFPYKILTPYAGAGFSISLSETGYRISASNLSINAEEEKMKRFGVTKVELGKFEAITKGKPMNTRVFGGLSFNLVYARLDLTGMYEFFGGNFGATLGLRFQM